MTVVETTMRILGLDVGDRRIGVALSDPLGFSAQRLTVLTRRGAAQDAEAVRTLAEEHAVETIVIGLPLTLRGEQGPQAKKVVSFSAMLQRHVTVPVKFVDERLTTVAGQRTLRETGSSRRARKGDLDQIAAQLILQQFLEMQRRGDPSS